MGSWQWVGGSLLDPPGRAMGQPSRATSHTHMNCTAACPDGVLQVLLAPGPDGLDPADVLRGEGPVVVDQQGRALEVGHPGAQQGGRGVAAAAAGRAGGLGGGWRDLRVAG